MITNASYGTREFWENRYQTYNIENDSDTGTFEWFKSYADLETPLSELIPKECRILQLGCGNSTLSEEMYENGWTSIANIDYSPSVIANMQARTSHLKEMSWHVADIFDLSSFQGFDIALDKGTLDAILTQKHDPWDPEPELIQKVTDYMTQIHQSLGPGGRFLHITFCQPHFRRKLVELAPWESVSVHKLATEANSFEYFIYEAVKPLI